MTIQEALNLYETTGNGRISSWADSLSIGLQTTIIGLIIVFLVLVVLMVVLVAMKYVFAPKTDKKEVSAPVVETAKETPVPIQEEDDEEIIAVLTAAIAASLNTSTYNLKIKSFKRVANTAPAWNKAGLSDTINSRF